MAKKSPVPPFSAYHKLIVECTGCPKDTAYKVESIMRDNSGGVLDHLTRPAFSLLAKRAWKEYQRDPNFWDNII